MKVDSLPNDIAHFQYCQYGRGMHYSDSPKLIACFIEYKYTNNMSVKVGHLVIKGSSQWVFGRNVTRKFDIIHIGVNIISVRTYNNSWDNISITYFNLLGYISMEYVNITIQSATDTSKLSAFVWELAQSSHIKNVPWPTMKRIIEKMQHEICADSSYSDIKTLLGRNNM